MLMQHSLLFFALFLCQTSQYVIFICKTGKNPHSLRVVTVDSGKDFNIDMAVSELRKTHLNVSKIVPFHSLITFRID